MPDKKPIPKSLESLGACRKALKFHKNSDSVQKEWDICDRGDWMAWMLVKCDPNLDIRRLALACCEFLELTLPYAEKYVEDAQTLIYTVEDWADRTPTSKADITQAAQLFRPDANIVIDPVTRKRVFDPINLRALASAFYNLYKGICEDKLFMVAVLSNGFQCTSDKNIQSQLKKQCADIIRDYFPEAPDLLGA